MNFKIVNRPEVKHDIKKAVEFYKQINPELAKQFLFRIREAIMFIDQIHSGFQVKYKNVRTLLLRQFPYHIHYLVDEQKQRIIILAIIHAYKNPKDYLNR